MIKETVANIGLLKTKYRLPGLNKHLVITRQILNHRLDDSLNHKLTLVTAPAGYGKTTAVLKWLEKITFPAAWLSLDAGDNEAIPFWRYFFAALDNILSGIGKDAEYIFTSQELLKANVHLSILIDNLSDIRSDFLLILDDFHFITNQTILDELSYFISFLPANLHLILLSRTAPRLKLAKLGIKEDLVRIRAKDLRFATEEIHQYYQTRGYFLQKEEIQRIENYTEGWAAALAAVTMSFKDETYRNHILNNFGTCNLQIENYLAEDVFHTWTREQQDFMVKTSIMERLCGPLCDAITNYDGDRLLNELYNQNSFLVALDDEGTWFRYHHLFGDFLRKELEKLETATIQDLHCRAGEWLKTNGFDYESIEHFLQGVHYEKALLLIERQGAVLLKHGEYAPINSWIERLPDKYCENSPMIMLIKACYFAEINDLKSAWKCIRKSELLLDKKAALFESLQTVCLMAKANLFYRQGDIENLFAAINKAAALGMTFSTNNACSRDYMDFNLYDISIYRTTNTFIKMFRQNPDVFYSVVENYRTMINVNPGYAPLIEGEFYYENGRQDEALPKLLASVDEAIKANCPGALVPAMVTLAKMRRNEGDLVGAMKAIEECEKKVETFHKPHWGYMLKAFKVRLYIDLNDTEKLNKWVKESRLSLYQVIIRTREYELIILARVLIEKKRYGDAAILLNRLLSFAEQLKRTHSIVEIANLLAITAIKNSNEEIAEKYFEKALNLGAEEDYSRSFVDEFAPMVSLLIMYLEKHTEENRLTTYARKLLKQTKDGIRHSQLTKDPDTVQKFLTPTEHIILQMIINAYDNKKIASELGITTRTVKAHTGSIYHKLDVKNRVQCLKKIYTDA